MTERMDKTAAYLEMIHEHVLRPIKETDLSESCTATLVLLFSAMDGLGKLLHPRDTVGSGNRFKYYIETYMQSEYSKHKDALYKLRNSIAHNALNFTAFISKTRMGEDHHLLTSPLTGAIFVSSPRLTPDFADSLARVEQVLKDDASLLARAESRLRWLEDDTYSYWGAFSTPPGPVPFVNMR